MFRRQHVYILRSSLQAAARAGSVNKKHSDFANYRRFATRYFRRQPLERREFFRYSSSHVKSNKTIPIILGVTAVSGSLLYAYSYFNKGPSPESKEEEDSEFYDEPFINKNLQQDLELLKEFGPIPYLLVGAGSASFTAYRAIRVNDPTAKVLIIGEEPFLPYMRPPLSKEMWFDKKSDVAETLSFIQWNGKERSLFYEPEDYYFSIKDMLENKNGGVSIIRSKKVVKVDPEAQTVYLDTGEQIVYEKCLVATGSKPKNLPVFEQADKSIEKHVTLFRTIRDFQKLDKISSKVKSVVIVGGGFLSSELACGLAKKGSSSASGLNVVQVFPESGNMGRILPEYLSKWTTKKLESVGVKIIPNVTVESVSLLENGKIELHLSNTEKISADHIVVAVGSDPNTELAKVSGLEVDEIHGGFLVNAEMEARKNLWIAGDASCFYDTKLGRRRIEHHDHAVVSGRLAGENMTGSGKPYKHQSMFWSDLGPDIGYEAIGIVDSKLPTVGVFARVAETNNLDIEERIRPLTEEATNNILAEFQAQQRAAESGDTYGKGVIFYLKDDVIVGIVLWNVFSKMHVARKIINESKSYNDLTEVAKLFELHSTDNELDNSG